MSIPQLCGPHIPQDSLNPNLRWHSLCYNNVRRILYICLNDALLRLVTLYFRSIFHFSTTNM